jgi:hypothetical protein
MVDSPLLKKIKAIQATDLKNWKGLAVDFVARPGLTLNAPNAIKKPTRIMEYLKVRLLFTYLYL